MTLKAPKPTHLLATLGLASALLFTSGPVVSAPQHDHAAASAYSNPAALRKAAANTTSDFISAHKQWAQARGAANKAQALNNLVAKAEARREMLAKLIKTNPAEALRVAIPEDKQAGLPQKTLELLEQHVEVEGTLEVLYEDYDDGSHKLRRFLNTEFNERFELHFAGKNKHLEHGTHVSINGLLLSGTDEYASTDGDVALSADEGSLLTLAADGGSTGGSNGGSAASTATSGEQATMVIMVNFQDNPTTPWTQNEVSNTVFGTANDFIRENSFQKTWLSGDVTGWYTLPLSSTSCDSAAIVAAARQAAESNGVNLSAYKRFIYAFPYTTACPFSGVASVGGETSSMLINGSMKWHTVAHEMGHNLGLFHSHAMDCGSSVIGSNCTHDEYGDGVDVMGRVLGHFNAFQKERLGWLNSSNITTVLSGGAYQLETFSTPQGSKAKALKIAKGIDPASGEQSWYYVEFRQAVGFDSVFAGNNNVLNGVVVHQGIDGNADSSYLLDMTPNSYSSSYADPKDPALVSGTSFIDSDAEVTITTDWAGSTGAQVSIDMNAQQSCIYANPSLSLTPNQSQWVSAGTQVAYSVTLSNNDSSNCNSRTFNLSNSMPSGWSSYFTQSSINLAPGASVSTTLYVSSAVAATDGFYNINITGSNGNHSASGTVTYVVDNPTQANNVPNAYNDSASTRQSTPVTINVLSNDNDPDGDTLTISSLSGVYGNATINSNGTVTFTPANGFSGTEVFSYSISDGNGGSASANVTVTVSSINSAPNASSDSASTTENTPVTINLLANDSDPDGDTLTISALTGVYGNASINSNGTVTFTPASGFVGTEVFSYSVTDGNGGSSSANVSVNVTASTNTNSAPVAVNDSVTLSSTDSVVIEVLNNDYDPENDTLRVTSVSQGAKGSVRINSNGTITYTPARSFKSIDSFTYTIFDGSKYDTATVSLSLQSSGGHSGGKGNGKKK